jgi:C4-dicarboxylate-specific signal transduction histidine kinase
LRQVLLALIANAKEAVGQQREARISIEATPSENGVTIAVLDSGAGIDSAIKDKIFDAFFSTKDPELHVGLGLTVARFSVEGWGGSIEIDENDDGGTRVRVLLPYWSKRQRDV